MTSQLGFFFAKKHVLLPGVYSEVHADAMAPNRGTLARSIAVIATGQGGDVGAVTTITNPSDITRQLIGGDLARMVELAMAPSDTLPGAATVHAIRVNKATAASASLGDLTLTGIPAGRIGKGTAYIRSTATDADDNVISHDLYLRNAALNLAEEYLGYGPAIRVSNTETVTVEAPTITIAVASGVVTVTLVSAEGTNTYAFDSDTIPTLEGLVAAINDTAEFTAVLVGPQRGLLTSDLMAMSIADATAAGGVVLSIGAQALVYALDGSRIATATIPETPGAAVSNTTWAYLTGGTEGTAPATQDWVDALALAESLDVHSLVLGSGDAVILAAALGHVNSLSDAKHRKERFLYCGAAKSTSKADFITKLEALAPTLGNARTRIIGIEPVLVNSATGKLETYPSYYAAAMLSGLKAGNRPEMSTTNKALSIHGLGYTFTVTELEDLTRLGITTARQDDTTGAFVVTQGLTGYTTDGNVIFRKDSGMDIADYLARKVRRRLKPFIGEVGDQVLLLTLRDVVVQALDEEVRDQRNREGVLTAGINPTTGDFEPAYRNVRLEMDGFDLIAVDFEAHPVGEFAYGTVRVYLTPVKIIATA